MQSCNTWSYFLSIVPLDRINKTRCGFVFKTTKAIVRNVILVKLLRTFSSSSITRPRCNEHFGYSQQQRRNAVRIHRVTSLIIYAATPRKERQHLDMPTPRATIINYYEKLCNLPRLNAFPLQQTINERQYFNQPSYDTSTQAHTDLIRLVLSAQLILPYMLRLNFFKLILRANIINLKTIN